MADPETPSAEPEAVSQEGWVDFRLGYQPGFDGLRGLAVTSFILYHGVVAYEATFDSSFLPGAFLWLEFFFVQSGFLITSLLLEEWHRTGSVSLPYFYARRGLRLIPALLLVVGFTVVWLLTASPFTDNPLAWREVWSGLVYIQNWQNAFDPHAFPLYLNHLWSLSVEEQFYLVAPITMLLLLRTGLAPRRIATILGAGALASVTWMAILAHRAPTASGLARPYYGTDARAQAFLVGMTFATAASAGLLFGSERARRLTKIAGWIGVPVLLALLVFVNMKQYAVYRGGFLLCSLSVSVILAEIVHSPDGKLARMLSWEPFRWTGEIAYGLYLWHWPVMLVVGQYVRWPEVPMILLEAVVAFAVAATSYTFVERPILRRFSPRFPRVPAERERAHGLRHTAAAAHRAAGALAPETAAGG